jgi:SPP1 family predicted phage head-tail adaptor
MPPRTVRQLSERGTLLSPSTVADTQGGRSTTWAVLATVSAQEIPVSAAERLQAKSIGSQALRRFRIRHRADVTAKMRFLWRGRVQEIHGVLNEDGGQLFLLLDVGEVT